MFLFKRSLGQRLSITSFKLQHAQRQQFACPPFRQLVPHRTRTRQLQHAGHLSFLVQPAAKLHTSTNRPCAELGSPTCNLDETSNSMPKLTFKYSVGYPAEDVERYIPGGYHPVLLNSYLKDNRYQILHKLGHGGFATVWVARDTENNRNVAIKIVTADKSKQDSYIELRILTHLTRSTLEHPGRRYIPTLIDHFYALGPNGRHLCLVTDVVGPAIQVVTEGCEGYILPPQLAHLASKQLMLAVDYLHQSGIAHGDIHTNNVLFRYAGLDTLTPDELNQTLRPPLSTNVTCTDGTPLPPNAPEHVVLPADYKLEPLPNFSEIQLVDFGEAFFINEPPSTLNTPAALHPPELCFKHELTQAVDIWNLGHTIFELVMSRVLFFMARNDYEFPLWLEKVLGGVPKEWVSAAVEKGIFTEEEMNREKDFMTNHCYTLREEIMETYNAGLYEHHSGNPRIRLFSPKDLDILIACLYRMLVVDPARRPTAQELLDDEWFVGDVCK